MMVKRKVFSIGTALAEGLEETIASAQNYSGELRVDIIPLKKLELDPDNPRQLALQFVDVIQGIKEFDSERARKENELASLESLANSIKSQGLINPVIVYKQGEKYRLIAGERRTLASLICQKVDIQAKILEAKPDPLKISLLQWIENIERSDLTLWERLKNLEKIVDAHAQSGQKNSDVQSMITVTELSKLIGCSKPQAMNYRAILLANEFLKRLISQNKIRNLEKAALISDMPEGALQQQMAMACVNGATLKELKQMAEKQQIKLRAIRPVETRGRQTSSVHFGTTKNMKVAKILLDVILNNEGLFYLTSQMKTVDSTNPRIITEAFRLLIATLEKQYE